MSHFMKNFLFICLACFSMCCLAAAQDKTIPFDHSSLGIDRYPHALDSWPGMEGWGHWRQYFPDHFRLGATAHLFFKNSSSASLEIRDIQIDGADLNALTTTPQKAGPVIWHRVNPEVVPPGGIGAITVRLREVPTAPLTIRARTNAGDVLAATVAPAEAETLRFGFVGFSNGMKDVYLYLENFEAAPEVVQSVLFDGKDVTSRSRILLPKATPGRPAMVRVTFDKPLEYGGFHTVGLRMTSGKSAMAQVRARDDRFPRGIVAGQTPLTEYHAKFFNQLYALHVMQAKWQAESETARLGFTLVRQAITEENIRDAATAPPGRIVYTNIDEPDAKDFRYKELAVFDRLGTSIMAKIEPVMRLQRRLDPRHETTIIVDSTFAPRNWLDYAQVPDVLIHDCYLPSKWHGHNMQTVPEVVDTLLSAVSPRPVHLMLWGTMNTGQAPYRAATPEENDMQVHYVLGGGAKGIHYFLDWNSYPTVFEGGYYVGSPRIGPLWKNMGRMNAEIERLAPLLAIGHPYAAVHTEAKGLWARSLLCGEDALVVVLVNQQHRIHDNVSLEKGAVPRIQPVENATVTLDLPAGFEDARAYQVTWDAVKPVALKENGGKPSLAIDSLRTSRVFVISKDPEIAGKLKIPEDRLQALRKSESLRFVTEAPAIADADQDDAVIEIPDPASGKLTISLTDPGVLKKARRIRTEGALRLEPGKWLGFFPPEKGGGEAELVFRIRSSRPLGHLTTTLISQTPNFPYRSHNVLAVSMDGMKFTEATTLKTMWNGGAKGGESLKVALDKTGTEAPREVTLRINMRDPGIVNPGEATNLVESLQLSWDPAK